MRRRLLGNRNSVNTIHNTFIGGVASVINTPELLASRLLISVDRISNFEIVGTDIQCHITGSYEIGNGAFYNLTTPYQITYYQDVDGLVYSFGLNAFSACPNLTEINFSNVTELKSNAFSGCPNLTTVNLPKVTGAGNPSGVFTNCGLLNNINFPLWNGSIGDAMFNNCSSLTNINISINGSIGASAFFGTNITSLNFANVTSIGINAFNQVLTLGGQIVGHNITTIGTYAFYRTKVTLIDSASCTSISQQAFFQCPNLVSVNLSNLNAIGTSAFNGCSVLSTFTAPNLTGTGNPTGVFANCTALNNINFPLWNNAIGGSLFSECTSLTNLTISAVGAIGGTAFIRTKITGFDFTNVTSIAGNAFNQATFLTGNVSGNSISTVGVNGFYLTKINSFHAPNLTSFTGVRVFFGCPNITSVYIPKVTSITSGAFENITMNATITVPVAMETINAGNPHAEIIYARDVRGATIIYV